MAKEAWTILYKTEVEDFMKGVGKKRVTLYKNREVALKRMCDPWRGDSNYRLVKLTLEVDNV
jgi:hypothetical protein